MKFSRELLSSWTTKSTSPKMTLTRSFSQVLLAMFAYILVGTVLTFYNKNILSIRCEFFDLLLDAFDNVVCRGFRFEVTMILYQSIWNCILAGAYCYAFLQDSEKVTSCAYWPTRITYRIFFSQLLPVGALFGQVHWEPRSVYRRIDAFDWLAFF
jgi:hypothetical protein